MKVEMFWNPISFFCDGARVRLFWIFCWVFFQRLIFLRLLSHKHITQYRATDSNTVGTEMKRCGVSALRDGRASRRKTIRRRRFRFTSRHDGRNFNLRLVLFPWIRTDCRSVSPQRCPHYFSLKSEWLSLQPQHKKLSERFIWNKAPLWAGSKHVSV